MQIVNKTSNKNFGIVFFIFFLILSVYPILNNKNINSWFLFIALTFLILGLLNSNLLSPLNRAWFKFGIYLGKFISPIVVGVVFFLVVTPISLIMKMPINIENI